MFVAAGVEVRAVRGNCLGNRMGDAAQRGVNRADPINRHPSLGNFGIELVSVELRCGAIGVKPEVELKVEVTIIVLAQAGEGMGEIDIIAAGAVVLRGETEEGKPAIGEEPLLGAGAGKDLAAVTGADFHLAWTVEAEAMVQDGADTRRSWHGDPAAVYFVLPASAA